MSLLSLNQRAFEKVIAVPGAAIQLVIEAAAPMRAIVGDSSATLNAMRGRLDNRKHWQVAVLTAEIPAGKHVRFGVKVKLTGAAVGGEYSGAVEETDLLEDNGLLTFFVS